MTYAIVYNKSVDRFLMNNKILNLYNQLLHQSIVITYHLHFNYLYRYE